MIDPTTSWFEMKQTNNKEAIIVANVVENSGSLDILGQRRLPLIKDLNLWQNFPQW